MKTTMLVRNAGPTTGRYGGGSKATAAAPSPSSSSSNDSIALPTRVVSDRATRAVGRISDEDFETSSYEETSESSYSDDNSEEYVPLMFGYINDNPRRRAGAPARSQFPTDASEEVGSQSSLSDISPLEAFVEHANTKRNCGKGARYREENEANTCLSSFDDDDTTSGVSDALPVAFERKRRTRGVGKVRDPMYETSDAESAISSDEDEAPLNAQLIYTLVNRLRNPLDEVTPEAFDYLDFSDANFKEVLDPLKKIKACIERRASYSMKQFEKIDEEIKAAVESLPSLKAIAIKVQTVKSRQLRPAQPTNCLYRSNQSGLQNIEVLPGLVARLRNSKEEVPLSEFEKVDWSDHNFEPVLISLRQIRAYMEAKEAVKAKPTENAMKGTAPLDDKIKNAILSLPAEKEMIAKVKYLASRSMSYDPANGDAIRDLIVRLKDPEQQVPLSTFQKLDWNDMQFGLELESLMTIRAFLEAKECSQVKFGEGVMGVGTEALDDKIRTATMSLPSEKEMTKKVQTVKSRQLKATYNQGGSVRVGGEFSPAAVDKVKADAVSAPPEKPKDATVHTVRNRPMSRGRTNGEQILYLIKRLKDPEVQVPLRAFDEVEWNDRNFARELEPLLQIRVYIEAREADKKAPGTKNMSGIPDLDEKIKTAILALPPEKAVAVKIQMIREHEMAPLAEEAKPRNVKVGKLSAPPGTVRKVKDRVLIAGQADACKWKEGELSASTSQVMQAEARVMTSNHSKYKTKESNALSEPTKTVRRLRHAPNRSVLFHEVEELTPGEIVDQDQVLAEVAGPQRLLDEAHSTATTTMATTPRDVSQVPSRPNKGPERRPRNYRPGNSAVSFSELPKEEADAFKDIDENLSAAKKRKPQRRRTAHKPGRNLSISSLPDLEAGEVIEEPALPDKSACREAAAAAPAHSVASTKATARPSGLKKKRRTRVNNNNRSCSFSEVALEEAIEVPDANACVLKGATGEQEVARAANGSGVAPPKMTRKLVRRRKPGEDGGPPHTEQTNHKQKKEDEAGRLKPLSRKGRRTNVTHQRSAETSMIEDEANGEIVERDDEAQGLYTSSGKASPLPEKTSTARAKDRELPAATRSTKDGYRLSDQCGAPHRRRQRLHTSKELSISAIPEDVPGEIVEDERDTFADTALVGSLASTMLRSLQSNGGGKTFPLMLNGSRRGSIRYGDRPNSTVRSSMDSHRVDLPPNAEPSAMPDAADTSRLPPPQNLRRSTELASRPARPPAKGVSGDAVIPPLRASR